MSTDCHSLEEMRWNNDGPDQSIGEEIANSISHGIGAVLCLLGLVVLTWRAAHLGVRPTVCCAIFGLSAVVLYLASTLYHALSHTRAFKVMRSLDHSSIYLLIAGTYTPFTLVGLRGELGWWLFGIVWACAAIGVGIKSFAAGKWDLLSTAMYLAMGWLCIFVVKSMFVLLTHPVFLLLLGGGLCYTAGIPFYLSTRKYMHTVWHLWVLGGTALHFASIWGMLR